MFNRSKIITNFSIALTGVVVATGVGFFYAKNLMSMTYDGNLSAGISLSSSHESVLTIVDKSKGTHILNSPSTTPLAAILSDPITSPINLVTPISPALKTVAAPSVIAIPNSAPPVQTSKVLSNTTNLNSSSAHTTTPSNIASPISSSIQTAAKPISVTIPNSASAQTTTLSTSTSLNTSIKPTTILSNVVGSTSLSTPTLGSIATPTPLSLKATVMPSNSVTPTSSLTQITASSNVASPTSISTSTLSSVAIPTLPSLQTATMPSTVTNLNPSTTQTTIQSNVVGPISPSVQTTATPSNGYKSEIKQQLESFINNDHIDEAAAEAQLTAEIIKSLQQHNQSTGITTDIQLKIDAAKTIKNLRKEHKKIVDAITTFEQTQTAENASLALLQTNSDQQKTVLDNLHIVATTNTANIHKYVGIGGVSGVLVEAKQELNQTTQKIETNKKETDDLDAKIKITISDQAQLVIDIASQQTQITVTDKLLLENAFQQAASAVTTTNNNSLIDEFNALTQEKEKHKDCLKKQKSQTTTLKKLLIKNENQKTKLENKLVNLNTKSQAKTQKLNELQKEHDLLSKQQQDYDAQIKIAEQKHTIEKQKLAAKQAEIAQIQANIFNKTTKQTELTTQEQLLRQSLNFAP